MILQARGLWEQWLNRTPIQWALRLTFATVITALLTQLQLQPLEFAFYDWRASHLPKPENSGQIVIIGIDDRTLQTFGHAPNDEQFLQTIKLLSQSKPRFIVSMIKPSEIIGDLPTLTELANTSQSAGLVYIQNEVPPPGQKKLEPLPPPFQAVRTEAAPIPHDRTLFQNVNVSRRMILRYQSNWTFPALVAQTYNDDISHISTIQGVFRYLESDQSYVRFHKSYPKISFSDVYFGSFDPRLFHDKVVIIGRDSTKAVNTFLTVPTSKGINDMSPMELQANQIDTLIANSSPKLTPQWMTSLLTFALALLTMVIVFSLRPVQGLLMLIGMIAAVMALSYLIDFSLNTFFPIAPPLLGLVMCYYFILPYRLILESKKSWEYYEKHRLLSQVEELKSNFMRLMSHDLKTPLARIQAMAEVIAKEPDRLSAEQQSALENVTLSAEELTQFVGSILNLSRIQSKKVKLDLKTRDITQLLARCVKACDHLARRKNIQIETEFEPLFSLKMDEDLMKQVFTNLIENAIKYSPENTKVKLLASEKNGQIQIKIVDQGIGIAKEELPFVFERFYRAQNAEFENTGTGLGLYLAKYFVNLHNGTIEVQSEPHVGSTFKVNLPISLEDEKGLAHV